MSSASNDQGRAFEHAFITSLYRELNKNGIKALIENDSAFIAAENAFNSLSESSKAVYVNSAKASFKQLFLLEPNLINNDNCPVELKIQTDDKGRDGDVRDIVIKKKSVNWEIGISVKHNHFAVKHSRLSPKNDFGGKWYGINCSDQYWNNIEPIFNLLDEKMEEKKDWKDLINKESEVYEPILNAFKDEVMKQYDEVKDKLPKSMVEYLLGEFDFYKVISIDKNKITRIQSFNLRGELNEGGTIRVPLVELPTEIRELRFKENSKNTLELIMNNDWSFSFRIHNASTKVEKSLKFDIQILCYPDTIKVFDCKWQV